MEDETRETPQGAISDNSRNKRPLDVRIIALLFYIGGGLWVLFALLLFSGKMKPLPPYRVLFGTVVLASALTQGIYCLLCGLYGFLCDWGLRRGMKLAWWLIMISFVYPLIYAANISSGRPVMVAIGTVLEVALIAWLWYRRELYGVRLALRGTKK